MEAMEAQQGTEDFSVDDADEAMEAAFLDGADWEASVRLAQELDGGIAGADELLEALRELDEKNELLDAAEEGEDEEDLARMAREAVEQYEADQMGASAAAADDGAAPAPAADYTTLTVAKLKNELRSRGLKVGGNKADLVGRLQEDDAA